jgi:hypothetical protein
MFMVQLRVDCASSLLKYHVGLFEWTVGKAV